MCPYSFLYHSIIEKFIIASKYLRLKSICKITLYKKQEAVSREIGYTFYCFM